MTSTARTALGAFPVVASQVEVDAFRAATGCAGRVGVVPLTFPMRWLMRPEIKQSLMTLLPEAGLIPVHESQSFEYARPLETEVAYTLDVVGQRAEQPERLFVTAVVRRADDGEGYAQLETILRLVSAQAPA